MQDMLNYIVESAEHFGLRLSPGKCQLIFSIGQVSLTKIDQNTSCTDWRQYDPVESSVVYLGSRVAEDGNTLAAIKHRICCADTVAKRLNPHVLKRRAVNSKLKGHFISSAVFASLLYGLEH